MARSSSDQRVAGHSCCSVVLLAREITSSRCEGGKAPRPARPRSILKTDQALGEIAVPPKPDGVTITSELGGDLKVGRSVRVGGSEDQPASEGQGLRCRTGSNQPLELVALRLGQRYGARE